MALQMEQETAAKRHSVTLDEYEQMCAAGVFGPETRIELIRDEILDTVPPSSDHEASAAFLDRVFNRLVGDAALI